MKTVFGCFLLSLLLSGCSVRHVDAPLQNTTTISDKQGLPDFALVHPLTDDPDNPSPNNPLIKKFGDIPEVRTYLRLKQKLGRGIGLNIDEAIELYTAEVHLYPTPVAKAMLKSLESDRKRYETLGIPVGGYLPSYILDAVVDASDELLQNPPVLDKQESTDFVLVHPFKDNPDNPSPNNPLIKKFGDIPEVRTYIRLQRKFLYGIGLNIDETIELYTVEAYLYPSLEANARLKAWKKVQMSYNIKTDSSDDASTDTETAD